MKTPLPNAASEGGRLASMHSLPHTPNSRRRLPKNRVVLMIALIIATIFVGTRARAVDSTSQSTMSKRQTIAQIVDCMRKRMSADKSRSYNEAMKACKDQIHKESDDLSPGVLVASESSPKR